MKTRKQRQIDVPGNPSRVKGKLVEAVVAAMHDASGVQVRTNVRLRPVVGGRNREIDVLIDGSMAGYPFRLAIECKNERHHASAPEIDAFVGKLMYLGIPTQQGIFVSVTGFTKGAADRARAAGMRTLVLVGLTKDRLRAVLFEAAQSIVHLLPVVTEWTVVSDIAKFETPWHIGCFFDESGKLAGTLADLAWRAWHERELPDMLGQYHLDLRVPKGWRHIINGQESVPSALAATVHVHGLTMTMRGVAEKYELINVTSGARERMRIEATFPRNQNVLHLGTFATEDELSAALKTQRATLRITARHRLPRLQIAGMLWPPSEEAWSRLAEITAPDANGRVPDPESVDVTALEKPSFGSLFEPVWLSEPLRKVLRAEFAE